MLKAISFPAKNYNGCRHLYICSNGCDHLYIYSKWLPPSLHLLKTFAAISTSTQNFCRHLYIYSERLPPSLHLLKTVAAISTSTQNGCRHLYIYSKQVDVIMAGQKKRQEHFPNHEIGRINGGRGFRTGGNVLQIGGNTFYDQKNKILMKIPKFKRSGIGIIAEFHGIPS